MLAITLLAVCGRTRGIVAYILPPLRSTLTVVSCLPQPTNAKQFGENSALLAAEVKEKVRKRAGRQ